MNINKKNSSSKSHCKKWQQKYHVNEGGGGGGGERLNGCETHDWNTSHPFMQFLYTWYRNLIKYIKVFADKVLPSFTTNYEQHDSAIIENSWMSKHVGVYIRQHKISIEHNIFTLSLSLALNTFNSGIFLCFHSSLCSW